MLNEHGFNTYTCMQAHTVLSKQAPIHPWDLFANCFPPRLCQSVHLIQPPRCHAHTVCPLRNLCPLHSHSLPFHLFLTFWQGRAGLLKPLKINKTCKQLEGVLEGFRCGFYHPLTLCLHGQLSKQRTTMAVSNQPCRGFQWEHIVLHQYLLHMACFT